MPVVDDQAVAHAVEGQVIARAVGIGVAHAGRHPLAQRRAGRDVDLYRRALRIQVAIEAPADRVVGGAPGGAATELRTVMAGVGMVRIRVVDGDECDRSLGAVGTAGQRENRSAA